MTDIIGIDLSLTATGICYGGDLHTIRSEPTGDTLTDRAQRLRGVVTELEGIIGGIGLWWQFDRTAAMAVIEAPAFSRTTGHHHDRSGLWWMVVHRLQECDIPVLEVTPTALKKFATGKGTATKADMRMALYQRANRDIRDDNQVDAHFLWQIGTHLLNDPKAIPMPKPNMTVVEQLRVKEGLCFP